MAFWKRNRPSDVLAPVAGAGCRLGMIFAAGGRRHRNLAARTTSGAHRHRPTEIMHPEERRADLRAGAAILEGRATRKERAADRRPMISASSAVVAPGGRRQEEDSAVKVGGQAGRLLQPVAVAKASPSAEALGQCRPTRRSCDWLRTARSGESSICLRLSKK